MTATRTCSGSFLFAFIFAGSLAGAAAVASPDRSKAAQGYSRAAALACRPEVVRLCPELNQTPAGSGRNIAICLKPYRNSLSPTCRKAVTAIFP